jgi:hypothetical protein
VATIEPRKTPTAVKMATMELEKTPTARKTATTEPTKTLISKKTPTVDYVATAAAKCVCDRDVYNCPDAEARICFDECKRRGAGDVHRLDRDGDGHGCEWE